MGRTDEKSGELRWNQILRLCVRKAQKRASCWVRGGQQGLPAGCDQATGEPRLRGRRGGVPLGAHRYRGDQHSCTGLKWRGEGGKGSDPSSAARDPAGDPSLERAYSRAGFPRPLGSCGSPDQVRLLRASFLILYPEMMSARAGGKRQDLGVECPAESLDIPVILGRPSPSPDQGFLTLNLGSPQRQHHSPPPVGAWGLSFFWVVTMVASSVVLNFRVAKVASE